MTTDAPLRGLLTRDPRVVTAGAGLFADHLREQAVPVTEVAWRPPIEGTTAALSRVLADLAWRRPTRRRWRGCRPRALSWFASPRLRAARPAPGRVSAQRPAADLGARLRPDARRAHRRDDLRGPGDECTGSRGRAGLWRHRPRPCHSRGAVGPMAGVVSPSMWLFELRDPVQDTTPYCS